MAVQTEKQALNRKDCTICLYKCIPIWFSMWGTYFYTWRPTFKNETTLLGFIMGHDSYIRLSWQLACPKTTIFSRFNKYTLRKWKMKIGTWSCNLSPYISVTQKCLVSKLCVTFLHLVHISSFKYTYRYLFFAMTWLYKPVFTWTILILSVPFRGKNIPAKACKFNIL